MLGVPGWKFANENPEQSLLPQTAPSKFQKAVGNIQRDIRDVTRIGTRVGETIASAPGNIANLVLGVGNYLSGGSIPTYGQVQEKLPFSLPTSSQAKEFTSKLTGGYTDPQSSGEEFIDNVISDFTNLLLPGGNLKAANIAIKGAQSLAGNVAGKIFENMGFGKGAQTIANIGTTIGTGLVGGRLMLGNRMTTSFDQAEKVAEGQFAKAGPLVPQIRKVIKDINKRDFPAKNFINERLESLERLIDTSSGNVPISAITQRVKDLNQFYQQRNLPPGSLKELHYVAQPLRDFIENYIKTGGKEAQEFGKYYREGIDIWKGFNNSSKIGDFLSKHIQSSTLKNPIAKGILFASPWFAKIPHVVAGIGAAIGVRETAKFIDMLSNSKLAAKSFAEIGLTALNNNAGQLNRKLKAFEKAVNDYGILPEGYEWAAKLGK
jgi:hypothetical protein